MRWPIDQSVDDEGEGRRRLGCRSSSCSRNAHDRNVLVRSAQSRINQPTLLTGEVSSGMIDCVRKLGLEPDSFDLGLWL